MLKPIIKLQGTTTGERQLAKLADSTFLGLWSYPCVYRDEGLAKNGIGQEVADLIVCFDGVLVIFSEKEIKFQENKDIKTAWGRWYRAAIKDSIKQLRGAELFIRQYPERLFLDKKCKVPFPFDLDISGLKIHLVSVARDSYFPCKKYFDQIAAGSSGSLVFMADLTEEFVLNQPFHVPDFDPSKTFIHVFDEFSINLLMTELGTAADFLHYLEVREHAIRRFRVISIPGEEDFLAHYLLQRAPDGYGNFDLPQKISTPDVIALAEGEWRSFIDSPEYLTHVEIRKIGNYWRALLNSFSDGILNANVGEGKDLPLMTHERALRCMAAENSFSRAVLSKAMAEKYNEVPTNMRSARVTHSLCNPKRLYIFLFFPHHESHKDYAEYRQERSACMQLYGYVARYKFPDVNEILIFATDSKGSQSVSETIIAVDASSPLTSEEQDEARNIMKAHSILNNISTNKKICLQIARPATKKRKYGRNETCPCGSGKKNKHCCNLS